MNKNVHPNFNSMSDFGNLDTLRYSSMGNFNTDFGFNGRDAMLQYFIAPADMIINGIGFSCSDDSGAVNGAEISVRLVKLNWEWEDLIGISTETYFGYYPSDGDSLEFADYFGEHTTSAWIDSTGGLYSLPPWTDNESPNENNWDYDLWSDDGNGVKVIPKEKLAAGNYQWIGAEVLEFNPEILAGEVFAVVVQHNGNSENDDRIGFWASSDVGFPGWKYYYNGRYDSTSPGWWSRNYTWDFAVAVDLVGGPHPRIYDVTELKTTISTEPRKVTATILTDNPGDYSGISSAELLYSLDTGKTYLSVGMIYNGDNIYSADIPGQPPDTYVVYKIRATDHGGISLESREFSYMIFNPSQRDYLIIFNGGSEYRAEQLIPYYLQNRTSNYDLWAAYGPVEKEMLDYYNVIIEIESENGPEDDNREAFRYFVENGINKLMIIGQEKLGYLNEFRDSIFLPGDFEYDILGVKKSYNDVTLDSLSNVGYNERSVLVPVVKTILGDSLATWISENNVDTLWYDPTEILGSQNWIDQFEPRGDIVSESFMNSLSLNGIERSSGHSIKLANGSEVIFMSFDPLVMNTDSVWIGNSSLSPLVQFIENTVTSAMDNKYDVIANRYELFQNYPNPFNPTTTIKYNIPPNSTLENSKVHMKIYDVLGNEIEKLTDIPTNPGFNEITFNGASLSSGVYFYVLRFGNDLLRNKMILIK